jgi:predicted transposase YdaD
LVVATWHDSIFQQVYSDPRNAAGLLRSALPRWLVDAIDWSTLRPEPALLVDAGLGKHEADLLFSVRLRRNGVVLLILIEHKSDGDHFAVIQLGRYQERIAERWCVHHQRDPCLPVIVTVLFHHGRRPWQAPASLAEFLLAGSLAGLRVTDPQLAQQLAACPSGPPFLDDLGKLCEAEILARPDTDLARLTNLCLRFVRWLEPDAVLAALERWQEALRRQYGQPGGAAAMKSVESYVLYVTDTPAEQLDASLLQLAGPAAGGSIMSTAEKLIAKGRAEGIAEGIAEGKAEGKAETLMRQLRRRFGDLPAAVEQRLRSATIADLDRWADRILDAATLEAVFSAD